MKRFVDDTFAFFVIAYFGVSGERKIFPQGVALETIVGEDATKIRMAGEQDTKKIPSFTLIPISTTENTNGARNGIGLCSIGLDPDPAAVLDTQQMVDNFEAFLAFGVVCTTDIHDTLELALAVVTEKSENGDDSGGGDVESELVVEDGKLMNEFWETLGEVGGVGVEGL